MEEGPQLADGTITMVEKAPREPRRYRIYIDGRFAFSVHEDVMIRYRLLKGEFVQAASLQEALRADELHKAYLHAVKLLGSRLRSEQELRHRLLEKGYAAELADSVLERLKQERYVDDRQFAEQLTRQRLRSQKKGRHWIKQELKAKGISPERIAAALETVDEESEYRMALELARKRYRPSADREEALKARRKLAALLQRRGYPSGVVSRVLRSLPDAEGAGEPEIEEFGE